MFSPTVEEDHNVRRPDVAVDDTLLLSMLNSIAHMDEQVQSFRTIW